MTSLPELELAIRMGTALAIGLVVGVERGWRERAAEAGSRTAGIRTYTLSGLMGGVFGALSSGTQSPWLIGFGFIGFSFPFALFKFRESIHDDEFSVTGLIAALTVFALGAYAVVGSAQIAAGAGVAVAGLLASRELLHEILQRLTWMELRSALMILAMSAIVLPVLPDRAMDPFGGINPYEIWLFAILVAAISFAGYAALKVYPPRRGIALAAMLGAVVSSTAVTLDLARRSRAVGSAAALAGGACLAAMVSLARVLVLVAIIKPAVAQQLAPASLTGLLVFGLAGGALLLRANSDDQGAITPGNPFELPTVLAFAAIFAMVSLVTALLLHRLGAVGLLAAATVAAIADVDAAVLATLRLAEATAMSATVSAILLALAINALTRCIYAGAFGTTRFASLFGGATVLALAAAGAVQYALRI